MDTRKQVTWFRKTAAAVVLPFAALGLAGCNSTSGSEQGADVEDVAEENVEEENVAAEESTEDEAADGELAYDGVYDQEFYDDFDNYVGEKVTVSANVDEVLTNKSFTIAGTDETSVEEVLVLHQKKLPEINAGLTVKVTGKVMESFDVPTVEKEMNVDLDDESFEDWDGEHYIKATNVDTSVDADS